MHSSTGIRHVIGLFLATLLFSVATATLSESRVTKGSKAAALNSCVADTPEIRRNHMDYLKHDRDRTVHQGIRDTQHSLNECVNCHAERDGSGGYKPINDEGQFCNACHEYVAVSLDCFQCHRRIPEDERPQIGRIQDATLPAQSRLGLMLEAGKGGKFSEGGSTALHAKTQGE